MKLWQKLVIPVAALAVVATACGDDDDDTAATTAATTASTAAAAATTSAAATTTGAASASTTGGASATTAAPTATTKSSLKLSAPVKILGLWEVKGESTNAINNFEDGAQFAIAEINAAGGIGGQQIDYQRIKMPLDAAGFDQATLQAIDAKPNAMIGFVSSNQIIAEAPKIADAKIPVITQTAAPQIFKSCTGQGCVGNDFVFIGRPDNVKQAQQTAQFAIDTFKPKTAALQCVNTAFGTTTCDAYKGVLDKAGVQIVATEKNEIADTDFSAQVLAIKQANPDVVLDGQFPNPLVPFANQLIENGVTVPHLDGSSSGLALASGNVSAEAANHLYGLDDCLPSVEKPDFSAKFKAKYGYDANYQVAETYDLFYIVKDAIERGGSADPAAIQKALTTTNWTGMCGTFKTDAANAMNHKTVILSFAGSKPKIEKTVQLPE
jgi:branched-chain amino acid transport system substrate-binding protein